MRPYCVLILGGGGNQIMTHPGGLKIDLKNEDIINGQPWAEELRLTIKTLIAKRSIFPIEKTSTFYKIRQITIKSVSLILSLKKKATSLMSSWTQFSPRKFSSFQASQKKKIMSIRFSLSEKISKGTCKQCRMIYKRNKKRKWKKQVLSRAYFLRTYKNSSL